jgi:predicted TIM-barrel fold metal-dependent hydrolase
MSTYEALYEFASGQSIINTHSHYQLPTGPRTLDDLMENSYVRWLNVPLGRDEAGRAAFLSRVRHNTYFVWLERSLQKLFGFTEKLTADNWAEWSEAIELRSLPDERVFREICGYRAIVLDAYWNPGADHGMRLFTPTFRINPFLYGYDRTSSDHNGNNALRLYGGENPLNFDEYLSFMRRIAREKKAAGCVALKCASAYDRPLDFQPVPKERAARAYQSAGASASEIKDFQDYVFFELCHIAAELDMPFQCHTGLGLIDRTNALMLREAIACNPDTRFVLFHGSYPWMHDIAALAHFFPNVYTDLCWLPIISTNAAERFLSEMLDVTTADKLMWGCDTWTPQESYGALLAMRDVLCRVLTDRIDRGLTDMDGARDLTSRILSQNAAALYRINV